MDKLRAGGALGGGGGAAGSGMAKFRRAMKNVKELNHQQSLFLPKARRLSEMHEMLHREETKETTKNIEETERERRKSE